MPQETVGHECGISAICAPGTDMILSLFQAHSWMQLRGQESAGIAATNGEEFHYHGGLGLVTDVFEEDFLFSENNGDFIAAVGHNRYSTTGSNKPENVQPIRVAGPAGEIYLAHNGDLTNVTQIMPLLESMDVRLVSTMDSELIAHLIVQAPGEHWEERISWAMGLMKGSYCIAVLTHQGVFVARDPMGNRPLTIGEVPGGFAATSSSLVFDILGGKFQREVDPGEIVKIDNAGVTSYLGLEPSSRGGACPFESIYFSAPEDVFLDRRALDVRRKAGALTARRFAEKLLPEVDCVIGVPDSGLEAAGGVAKELGTPQKFGIRKNPASRRTFIDPRQAMRRILGAVKYFARRDELEGVRVLVVDDSTIRWNAIINVLDALIKAEVKEIHLLFTWWPVRYPCYYGIDMYTREELPASKYDSIAEVEAAMVERYSDRRVLSVTFATPEIIAESVGQPQDNICTGCWGGVYPEEIIDKRGKEVLEITPAR